MTGEGTAKNANRYCLPEKLADWKNDPLYMLAQKMRENTDALQPWQEIGRAHV